jgi:hypothetical protein
MICTTNEILIALGLTGAGSEITDLLALLQPGVERMVKAFVRYNIEQKTHTEYYPSGAGNRGGDRLVDGFDEEPGTRFGGWSSEVLALANVPVRSVATVNENPNAWRTAGGSWSDSTLLANTSYMLDLGEDGWCTTGHLIRLSGTWSATPRAIRVVYTAGYTAPELAGEHADFKMAVYHGMAKAYGETVANRQQIGQAGIGPIQSESLAGWSVSYARAAENLGMQFDLPASAKRILEPRVRMSAFM